MSDQNHTPAHHLLDDQQNTQNPPIAVPTKESEPIHTIKPSEIVQPKEQVSEEVVNYIRQHEQTMQLPQNLKDMGFSAGADEQIRQEDIGPHLSISDEKIIQGMQQPITTSWRWLSEFLNLLLKQAHYTLKTVGGHVKRILVN